MYKYEVIVYWTEDDEAYIAEVPELQDVVFGFHALSAVEKPLSEVAVAERW